MYIIVRPLQLSGETKIASQNREVRGISSKTIRKTEETKFNRLEKLECLRLSLLKLNRKKIHTFPPSSLFGCDSEPDPSVSDWLLIKEV